MWPLHALEWSLSFWGMHRLLPSTLFIKNCMIILLKCDFCWCYPYFFLSGSRKKKDNKRERLPSALFELLRHFSPLNKKNSLRSNSFLFLTLRKAPPLHVQKVRPDILEATSLRSLRWMFFNAYISFFHYPNTHSSANQPQNKRGDVYTITHLVSSGI